MPDINLFKLTSKEKDKYLIFVTISVVTQCPALKTLEQLRLQSSVG
jgi:hypothetical protein